MCFLLYVGADRPLPATEWNQLAPDVCVGELSEDERKVSLHFSKPVVQQICSTAGCGCDFPSWSVYNKEPPDPTYEERDEEQIVVECKNTQRLADLLRSSGQFSVELYGVWVGNESLASRGQEQISLDRICERSFRFREQVLYSVAIR
jgi:hypothetical protein